MINEEIFYQNYWIELSGTCSAAHKYIGNEFTRNHYDEVVEQYFQLESLIPITRKFALHLLCMNPTVLPPGYEMKSEGNYVYYMKRTEHVLTVEHKKGGHATFYLGTKDVYEQAPLEVYSDENQALSIMINACIMLFSIEIANNLDKIISTLKILSSYNVHSLVPYKHTPITEKGYIERFEELKKKLTQSNYLTKNLFSCQEPS